MQCPFCRHEKTTVVDSRTSQPHAIRRRRECLDCQRRFTTYEKIEESPLRVIKKDGSRVPFDRERIRSGLEKACYKRPIRVEQIHQLVEAIEERLFREHVQEIAALDIGRAVADRLKKIDQVAYVRYASVYKAFKDIDDLLDEVREVIESTAPPEPPDQGRLF